MAKHADFRILAKQKNEADDFEKKNSVTRGK